VKFTVQINVNKIDGHNVPSDLVGEALVAALEAVTFEADDGDHDPSVFEIDYASWVV